MRFQAIHYLAMHLDIIVFIGVVLVGGVLVWEQQVLLGGRDSLGLEQLQVIKNGLMSKRVNY